MRKGPCVNTDQSRHARGPTPTTTGEGKKYYSLPSPQNQEEMEIFRNETVDKL